jgi:PH (Pleckstrin Homology) domain-containing protein
LTYRLPLAPRLLAFALGAVAAVAFLALGSTAAGGIIGAGVVVGLPLSFRTRVSVDASGVRVVNLHTRRIPWSEVAGFTRDGTVTGYLYVLLRDGGRVRCYAVTTGGTRSLGGYSVSRIDAIAAELEQYRRRAS